MKKRLFLLFIVHCSLFIASAQSSPKLKGVEWGGHVGAGFTRYRAAGYAIENKLGWQAGIGMLLDFGDFAVGPEVNYAHHALGITHPVEGTKHLKANFVDVPVLFSYRALPIMRFEAGPVFTLMNDCKYASDGNNLLFGSIRPMVGYMLGLGAQLTRHFVVNFRYYGQFAPKKCVYPTGQERRFKMRSYAMELSVGFVL